VNWDHWLFDDEHNAEPHTERKSCIFQRI